MSSEQLAAYERLKSCLARTIRLAFPSPDAQPALVVNVSKTAIGAVFNQGEVDHWVLLFFLQYPCNFQSSVAAPLDLGITSFDIPNFVTQHFGDSTQVVCDQSTGAARPVVRVTLKENFSTPKTALPNQELQPSFVYQWNVLLGMT